ncbi:hypothetical protein ABZ721_31535 [Streptomyces sp. NPDC006733]|uniref:hypothetical protein n=1 Tax=Streptomyces sp. NPDC006733 TaxID=3155460 RepID=UPI0033ED8775
MSLRSPVRTIARAGVALSLALAGLLAVSPVSQADDGPCSSPWCSETYNVSGDSVYVARSWCGDQEWLAQDAPPCGAKDTDYWLQNGHGTNPNQDWDSFRVDVGWCYTFQTTSFLWGEYPKEVVDRRGKPTAEWVRVHDDETTVVISQGTTHC